VNREDDLRLLRDVLETERMQPDVRAAFRDMLHGLTSGERFCLSDKQRAWVAKVLDVPDYENLVSRGEVSNVVMHRHKELAPCTPQCPAWRPPALENLPKRPPGGRA
jgi:hypothetical protein